MCLFYIIFHPTPNRISVITLVLQNFPRMGYQIVIHRDPLPNIITIDTIKCYWFFFQNEQQSWICVFTRKFHSPEKFSLVTIITFLWDMLWHHRVIFIGSHDKKLLFIDQHIFQVTNVAVWSQIWFCINYYPVTISKM